MKQKFFKKLALGLAAVTAMTSVLTGCGGSGNGGANTSFSWLLDIGVDSYYYEDFDENPVAKYWLAKDWTSDGSTSKVQIDFITPPQDSAQDNFNTLLATKEYPDVMGMINASETPATLYEQGVVIDLTDLIDKYMPNYKAWLDANPVYAQQMVSHVNGEEKMLMLYNVNDALSVPWEAFMYRRDWIVKYGKDADGNAFSGGWNADKTAWTDDVVFPSGGPDPVYISDWEWMFAIFEEALEDLGVEDGYPFQMMYTGYYAEGDLTSSFGGGRIGTYVTKDGDVAYGGDTDSARAYIECLHHWYEEGWLDQDFEENSNDDAFFMIDTESVFTGKVGMWIGVTNQLEGLLDNGDPTTEGAYVAAAAQPINDIYGDASCQNVQPDTFYQNTMFSSGVVLTNKTEGKDIGKLLTAIDYMYTREGSLMMTAGLSKEQQAEAKDPVYDEYGLSDGAYTLEEKDGEEWIIMSPAMVETDGLLTAASGQRLVGMGAQKNMDLGYSEGAQYYLDQAILYEATGNLGVAYTGLLSSEVSAEVSAINTTVNTYLATQIPEFITGRADIEDDAQWQAYVDQLEEFGAHRQADEINKVLAGE